MSAWADIDNSPSALGRSRTVSPSSVLRNDIAIGRFRGFLVVLFVSVSFLLVLACVNVAILLLARGEARQTEIAMRKALGAGRHRIARQLLTEEVLLSAAGGCLGVLVTLAGIRLVQNLI